MINHPASSSTNPVPSCVLTKRFIRDFNFPNPDWSALPPNFPNIPNTGLTKEEGHLLDGIKLAWVVDGGRRYFYKSAAKRTLVGITIVVFLLLGRNFVSTSESLTRSVSAKTVGEKVGEIVEATMSAVFRK